MRGFFHRNVPKPWVKAAVASAASQMATIKKALWDVARLKTKPGSAWIMRACTRKFEHSAMAIDGLDVDVVSTT